MSAEPPIVQQAERVKTWWRLFVLLAVVLGIVAIVLPPVLSGPENLLPGIALAAGFWSGAATIHFTWLSTPQPERRTHRIQTADGAQFRIDLRPQLPLMMLSIGLGLALFFGIGGIWLGSLWSVVGVLFALLGLYILPDAVRALATTGRHAVLDARGLTYQGYSYDTRASWDDITAISPDDTNPRLPALRFDVRPGVTLPVKRHRWLAHLEPPTTKSGFKIPALVLDQPWNLLTLCKGMTETPADHRARYLESVGSTMLTDPSSPSR